MTLYLRIAAPTCKFAVQVGTALIVLIKVYAQKRMLLLPRIPVLQNCEDLSTKQTIDLVSTEYPRPQNSSWLEKVERIFKIVKNKVYALFNI